MTQGWCQAGEEGGTAASSRGGELAQVCPGSLLKDTWLQSPVGTLRCIMDQHQPSAARGAVTQHIPLWGPCRLLQAPRHGMCPPEHLLWAHHPLWSSDGFGDPSFTQIQDPRQPRGSAGKALWLSGYRLGRDAGSHEPHVGTAPGPWGTVPEGALPLTIAFYLPGWDADAEYPGVALTPQQQQGQLSSACSSCLWVLVSGQESHGWPRLSCQRYREPQPTWNQSFKPKWRK